MELKNDMKIRGTLHSVDQFLNIKLEDISVIDEEKFPHMVWWAVGAEALRIQRARPR